MRNKMEKLSINPNKENNITEKKHMNIKKNQNMQPKKGNNKSKKYNKNPKEIDYNNFWKNRKCQHKEKRIRIKVITEEAIKEEEEVDIREDMCHTKITMTKISTKRVEILTRTDNMEILLTKLLVVVKNTKPNTDLM